MKSPLNFARQLRLVLVSAAIGIMATSIPMASFADAIVVHGVSYHFSERHHPDGLGWNQVNYGIGYQKEITTKTHVQVGAYKNNIRNTELYFVSDFSAMDISPVQLGVFVGARTVQNKRERVIEPGGGVFARWDLNSSGFITFRLTPRASRKGSTTAMVEVGIKFP